MTIPYGPLLVVEDIPNVLELLEVTLRFKGYPVVSARNGQEALELLKGYMGDRLGRSGASLTAAEAGVMLKNAGVEPDLAGLVREVFDTCEMWAYAGHTGAGDSREKLLSGIREAARKLDKKI